MKKEKRIVKERIYIGFDFCKGDAIKGFERGLLQNRGGDGCPSPWPLGRLWERERVRALMGKCVEFWRKLEEVWIFGIFGK